MSRSADKPNDSTRRPTSFNDINSRETGTDTTLTTKFVDTITSPQADAILPTQPASLPSQLRGEAVSGTIILEVNAAYNRDGVPMPKPNGPNGRRVLNLEMLMNHPLYWDFLNERETEEVLMEIYITRTRRMQ